MIRTNEPSISYPFNPYVQAQSAEQQAQKPDTSASYRTFSDRAVEMGVHALGLDYERQLEITRVAANAMDQGRTVFSIGMQASLVLTSFLSNCENPLLLTILQVVALPFFILFFLFSPIQLMAETIQCSCSADLINAVDPRNGTAEDRLRRLHTQVFSLEHAEVEKIKDYVEKQLEESPVEEKRVCFDQIAQKVLQGKLENLGRMVSPSLAKEVDTHLNEIMQTLASSTDLAAREIAQIKGEVLLQTVSSYARKKLAMQMVAIALIVLSIAFISIAFVGALPLSSFLIVNGIIAVSNIGRWAYDRWVFQKGGDHLKARDASAFPG